jgi:hypothetical protein
VNVLVAHIPHAVPVVVIWGLMLRYWLVQRRLERDGMGSAAPPPNLAAPALTPAAPARPAVAVRRSVAVRGLLALGPLVGALATGLVIYALNLGRGHAGAAAIWTHVGLSLLALLLVLYKISDIGLARLRQSLRGARAWRGAGALVLLALWVPLLASGIALLLAPSEASFTAYAHLIASVWWTGLFLWHLRRYLVAATRAVLARPATSPDSAGRARVPALAPAGPRAGRTGASPGHRGARSVPAAGRDLPLGRSEAGVPATDGASAPIPGRR